MVSVVAVAGFVELGDWVWQRHHNVLSWYIRPLFLIPLAWLAYRRSGWGLAVLNVMALGKLCWGVVAGQGTGWAMTVPRAARVGHL